MLISDRFSAIFPLFIELRIAWIKWVALRSRATGGKMTILGGMGVAQINIHCVMDAFSSPTLERTTFLPVQHTTHVNP